MVEDDEAGGVSIGEDALEETLCTGRGDADAAAHRTRDVHQQGHGERSVGEVPEVADPCLDAPVQDTEVGRAESRCRPGLPASDRDQQVDEAYLDLFRCSRTEEDEVFDRFARAELCGDANEAQRKAQSGRNPASEGRRRLALEESGVQMAVDAVELAAGRDVDAHGQVERLLDEGRVRALERDGERMFFPLDLQCVTGQEHTRGVLSPDLDPVAATRQIEVSHEGRGRGVCDRLAVAQEDDLGDRRAGDDTGGEGRTEDAAFGRQQLDARHLVEHDRLAAAQEAEARDAGRHLEPGHLERAAHPEQAAAQAILCAELEPVVAGRKPAVEVKGDVRASAAHVMGDDEGVGQAVAQEDIAGDRHAIEDLAGADRGEVVGWQPQPAANRRAPVLAAEGFEVERDARQGHRVHVEHCFNAQEAVHPAGGGRLVGPAQPLDELLPTDGAAEPPLQAAALGRGQAAAPFRLVQHPESAGRLCLGVVVRACRLFRFEGQVDARVRRPQPHRPRVEVHLLDERQDDLVLARRRRATELMFEPPAVEGPGLDPPEFRLAGFNRLPERGLSGQEDRALHRG